MAKNTALRQFLRSIKQDLRGDSTLIETTRALDKWTIIACQALDFGNYDIFEFALKLLHEAYAALPVAGTALTEKRLAVIVRFYAVGSLAVRLAAWEALRSIVLRPAKVHPADNEYVHSSWIRHGHVEAARAGLTRDDDTGAYLISASRQLLAAHPSMRPDLTGAVAPDTNSYRDDDVLLNSLCQFDIFYCLLVVLEGTTSVRSMYPSSAAFNESRADPALVAVAGDDTMRAALFPGSSDADIAAGIYHVVRLCMQEAMKFGGHWWGPPPSVQDFIAAHGQNDV
ncbi:hypothetical protein [Mycobacterium paraintracellulare]|uniref:hypothetical protein n=1 Tax=Mycobacterium paraintracellulare TaxID=1138383 RepID=UPI001915E6E2|nr:hypothetical protein [Mycobacterium paraintracellulare]